MIQFLVGLAWAPVIRKIISTALPAKRSYGQAVLWDLGCALGIGFHCSPSTFGFLIGYLLADLYDWWNDDENDHRKRFVEKSQALFRSFAPSPIQVLSPA